MSAWWDKTAHADRRPLLLARGRIKVALTAWLQGEGFQEVEPGALCVSPGNETHLHAFATQALDEAGRSHPLYLHTSPEFAMKKLLAAGEERIFAFANVYRNREQGSPLHASEFTMLEWYRARETYDALFDDVAAFLRLAAEAAGAAHLRWRGAVCDPTLAPEKITVAAAFARFANIDLLATMDETGQGDRAALAAHCARVSADDSWSDLFSRLLVEHIEPHLGIGRASILYEYPMAEAALARACPHDPRVAERFELYACGVELANGFGELTDAAEQRARFLADMDLKERLYGERYPLDEDFLAALPAMPEASGCALGFDRLVLLATGAGRVADVRWTG